MLEWMLDLSWLVPLIPLLGFNPPDVPAPPPPPAPPSFETVAGETPDEATQAKQQVQPILDQLQQFGISDEQRAEVEQQLLVQRGEDLKGAVNQLQGLADQVTKGLIQPDQLREMADHFHNEVQSHISQGATLNFNDVANTIAQKYPDIQAQVQNYYKTQGDISQLGQGLGKFDQADFESRYAPAIKRLMQDYGENVQGFEQQMNARGLMPQGSFAAGDENKVVSGSEPWEHGRVLLGREFAREAGNIAQGAQAQSEAQKTAEYQARAGAEPAIATGGVQAAGAPLEAAIKGGQSALELYSGQGGGLQLGGQELGMTQAEQAQRRDWAIPAVNTASQYYNDLMNQYNAAQQKASRTGGTSLAYGATPQSQRLGFAAGVAAPVYSAQLGYSGNLAQIAGQQRQQDTGFYQNLFGAGLGAGGGAMAMLCSADFKEDIMDMSDEEYEKAIDDVLNMRVKHWKYRDEIADGGEHIGIIAEEAPEDIKGADGKTIDVISYLGKLTAAVQGLAKSGRSPLAELVMEV